MKQHIQDTLTDINTRITELQALRDNFSRLFSVPASDLPEVGVALTIERGTATIRPPKPASPKLSTRKPAARKPAKSAAAPNPLTDVVAKLPEPFNTADIVKASGCDQKKASNFLVTRKISGLVKPSGEPGKYIRTAKWNKTINGSLKPAKPAPAAAPSLSAESRVELQTKLENAVRGRDYAREQGRDSIVEMFQNDINQLETQLGL
jgi:hypothetical protein